MQNILKTLQDRGFIDAMTGEEVVSLADQPLTLYLGFDPTSDSLHLGNLVAMMALAWFEKLGHKPIALVGGATGMIGGPSGRSSERNLRTAEILEKNLEGITRSLRAVLKETPVLNNYTWFADWSYLNFLRDIGKHFRMGTMLGRESVRARLDSEAGLSYTEFSYQLLQAYDFLHLYDHHGVTLQLGGSDQWGNIVAGTELVRRMRGADVHGVTFPLITRSDGKKFGKSEEGAIWLNRNKLAPYDFYQYLYRLPDADMPKLLRLLTFLELAEIEQIEAQMAAQPNSAQKRLAQEVTRLIHGEEGLAEAERVTAAAAPGAATTLDAATLEAMPSRTLDAVGMSVIDVLVAVDFASSKGAARRLIDGGGVALNNKKVQSSNETIDENHLVAGRFLLLSVGKKKKIVVRCEKTA